MFVRKANIFFVQLVLQKHTRKHQRIQFSGPLSGVFLNFFEILLKKLYNLVKKLPAKNEQRKKPGVTIKRYKNGICFEFDPTLKWSLYQLNLT